MGTQNNALYINSLCHFIRIAGLSRDLARRVQGIGQE
jgi:hypothetical protein